MLRLQAVSSHYERAAFDVHDRSGGEPDGHKGENLPGDVFTLANPSDGQGGSRLDKHVTACRLRHARAYRRIDCAWRYGIHSDRHELKSQTAREGLKCAIHGTDNHRTVPRTDTQVA